MKKNVVVVGGGTGSFTVLRGLKGREDMEISAIVTMADDGGSNKVLRDQFGLLPTSGIRQCIVALASEEGLLRDLFNYRYHKGTGIAGMTFGNLFMAALSDIAGSQKKSIEETCQLLGVRGRILPVSYEAVSLLAEYEDGREVLGEHYIDVSNKRVAKKRIVKLRTVPESRIDKSARAAIISADLIVFGPGDLYTNTVANLVVKGMKSALKKSQGKLVFVMNLMTKLGESYDYRASDFLVDFEKYIPKDRLDLVIVNKEKMQDQGLLEKYRREGSIPVEDDLPPIWGKARVVRANLLSSARAEKQAGDELERSIFRHDSDKLARVLIQSLYA
ncbi:MAG: hypothetical protein UY18_C0003G0013 [Microgenomates group bacterium GW2011_GWF2_47_9]|nr:MAG: hypothetical protein UY18_C0003G0013 [Microgenomates group bacterium GW2011_GWF2_47_9]